jgi:hypothetical protein
MSEQTNLDGVSEGRAIELLKAKSPWERAPNMLIPTKKIAMDVPDGSLQYVADVQVKTPVGAYNLITSQGYLTSMVMNIPATAARSEGGVPVINPNDVRFIFDTKHVGIGGFMRASTDAAGMLEGGDYTGDFFWDGTAAYTSEGGTLLANHGGTGVCAAAAASTVAVFATNKKDMCERTSPTITADVTISSPPYGAIYLPTMARNTRLEIFESVEIKFNNSTTVMKVTDPGRLYKYVNDFYGPKAVHSDSCGDISTCPTQYNFPKTWDTSSYIPTASQASLTEITNPINGDQRRYHAGEWFDKSRPGDLGKYTVYLTDMFPAFNKDELMSTPPYSITFRFKSNFRELFTVYPNTYVEGLSAAGTVIHYPPTTYDVRPAVTSTTIIHVTDGTSAFYKNKDYFGITGCTYKVPTYATKAIMVPRLFNNVYKSFELAEHVISTTDETVRIVKTLIRPPIGAFIFFQSLDTEKGPRNTVSELYCQNTFNDRWWPLNRQVSKITTFKDSLEQSLGTSEYMQWSGTSTRRMNREHLIREARELSGNKTRMFDSFWSDSADFIKKPFIAVRFDNNVVDPGTARSDVTDTRFVSNEFIIELKFDYIDPTHTLGTGIIDTTSGNNMMTPRKLIVVYVYEQNFKSLGDNVISTQVN